MTRLQKLLALGLVAITPLAARAQNITTVVGGGPVGLAPTAGIGAPVSYRKDSLGNVYILDNNYGRVYKVDHTTHLMSVFAGNGINGYNGNGILAVDAAMSGPSGMCLDSSDNVYIADSDNAIMREVPVSGPNAGKILTVAGVQTEVNFTYGGDGGAATSANLHFPDGCSFDSNGNMYIADRGNNAIRVVIGATAIAPVGVAGPVVAGNIYLFAGAIPVGGNPPAPGIAVNGSAAHGGALNGPFDVFVDTHNNVFIAEPGNPQPAPPAPPINANVVTEVAAATAGGMTAGDIYIVAGTPSPTGGHTTGVPATTALLNQPIGLYVDASGNLFFADQANQVIREVPAVAATGMTVGDIYDVAGHAGARGYAGDGGPAISASLSFPAGTFVDATGSIFISDSNSNAIRQVTSNTGNYTTETISTFAGNGNLSFANSTPATAGELNTPAGIYVDGSGNLLIADTQNDLIRKVAAPIASGALSTVTGRTGDNGFAGDGAAVATGVENTAAGVFADGSGNIFIADTLNCIVREITGGNIVTIAGTDPTPAGNNTTPVCGFAGAGGVATAATIGQVNGVAVDGTGNVFFSDSTNNIIWEVAKNTAGAQTAGHIYIAAGTHSTTGAYGGDGGPATAAQFNSPTGIFIDVFGNLFIADTNNNVIREVSAANTTSPAFTAGNIYTVAGKQSLGAGFGGDGGPATSAQLNKPFTMVVDHAGNIFIADSFNQVIREVTAANGNINTVAGTHGSAGFGGDGGPATSALLDYPEGLALDGAGDLLLADSGNVPGPLSSTVGRIRSIAALASEGAVPVASFSESSVTFLPQPLNITSAAQTVTLTNTGGATLTGIVITKGGTNAGDFAVSNTTCTSTLAAAANCTISVTFTPSVLGARSATLSVADNALGNPQIIDLSGSGIAGNPADVTTPPSLTFTTQTVGTTSAAQNITVSNATGTAPLSIAVNGIAISGTNAGDFLISANNCGTTVAIGASCMVSVEFKPTSATPTARSASLTVTDNAADSPRTVTLTGTAQAASAPAATLSVNSVNCPGNQCALKFTDQFVTTTSAGQTVTLTNSGNATLSNISIAVSGANASDYKQTNTCGASVAAGKSCTISVTFGPAASGATMGTITITDNATPSTQTINLSGSGFTISLVAASGGSLSQTVTAGQTATYNLQFTSTGSASDTVSVALACSGAPTASTCTAPATTPAPGTFSVTASTTARGALLPQSQPEMRMQPPAIRVLPLTLMALLLCIAALLAATQSPAGRMRTARIALMACLVLLPIAAASVLAGCGGGSSSTPPPPTGTPAGTYTLTLTATPSGGTAQTTQLTLIVQ